MLVAVPTTLATEAADYSYKHTEKRINLRAGVNIWRVRFNSKIDFDLNSLQLGPEAKRISENVGHKRWEGRLYRAEMTYHDVSKKTKSWSDMSVFFVPDGFYIPSVKCKQEMRTLDLRSSRGDDTYSYSCLFFEKNWDDEIVNVIRKEVGA